MNLSFLPPELQHNIISRLDERSLSRLAQVDTHFHALAKDRLLDHPRIDSRIYNNVLEGRYFKSEIPVNLPKNTWKYLRLVNGEPEVCKPNGFTVIDSRTTLTHFIAGDKVLVKIAIDDRVIQISQGVLVIDGEKTVADVNAIACLNGHIIYSQDKGLYLYQPITSTGHLITKRSYQQIVCDENEGIIYGLKDDVIEKLDFNHPDAITQKEDTNLHWIKAKVKKLAGAFFNGFLNNMKVKFDWKVSLIIIGAIFVFEAGISLIVAATLIDALLTGLVLTFVVATVFGTIFILEAVKAGVEAAYDAAFEVI